MWVLFSMDWKFFGALNESISIHKSYELLGVSQRKVASRSGYSLCLSVGSVFPVSVDFHPHSRLTAEDAAAMAEKWCSVPCSAGFFLSCRCTLCKFSHRQFLDCISVTWIDLGHCQDSHSCLKWSLNALFD